MKKGLKELILFGLIGVSNTIVNTVVYMVLVHFNVHYIVASIAGFVISVLNAYFWQNNFLFKEDETKEKRIWWKVLLKTYAAYAFTGLFLNNILLIFWMEVINIVQYTEPLTAFVNEFGFTFTNQELATDIAPFLNIVITIPLNFIINKFWTYRQKQKTE